MQYFWNAEQGGKPFTVKTETSPRIESKQVVSMSDVCWWDWLLNHLSCAGWSLYCVLWQSPCCLMTPGEEGRGGGKEGKVCAAKFWTIISVAPTWKCHLDLTACCFASTLQNLTFSHIKLLRPFLMYFQSRELKRSIAVQQKRHHCVPGTWLTFSIFFRAAK